MSKSVYVTLLLLRSRKISTVVWKLLSKAVSIKNPPSFVKHAAVKFSIFLHVYWQNGEGIRFMLHAKALRGEPEMLLRLLKWIKSSPYGNGSQEVVNLRSLGSLTDEQSLEAHELGVLCYHESSLQPTKPASPNTPIRVNFHTLRVQRFESFTNNNLEDQTMLSLKSLYAIALDNAAPNFTRFHLMENENGTSTVHLGQPPADTEVRRVFIPKEGFNQKSNEVLRDVFLFSLALCENFVKNGKAVIPTLQMTNAPSINSEMSHVSYVYHFSGPQKPNVISYKESSIPGRFTMSPFGYSGWAPFRRSELANSLSRSDYACYDSELKRYQGQKKTKYEQQDTAEVEFDFSGSPTILLTLQTQHDKVLELHSMSSPKVLNLVSGWANQNNVRLFVKRHPHCRSFPLEKQIRDFERAGLVTSISGNPRQFFNPRTLLLTGNSGTGLEAIMNLVPVVSWGYSEYSAYSKLVLDENSLLGALDDILLQGEFSNLRPSQTQCMEIISEHLFSAADPNLIDKIARLEISL